MTTNVQGKAAALAALGKLFQVHGWPGRMHAAEKWILDYEKREAQKKPDISLIAVKHDPGRLWKGFSKLQMKDLVIESIFVDATDSRDMCPDAHLWLNLASEAPWFTAYNLGAAFASGQILVFVDANYLPDSQLVSVYVKAFRDNPELLCARGRLAGTGLPIIDVGGSLALPENIEYWPIDLDENFAILANSFYALGGFDETLDSGSGCIELSIRLFGASPNMKSQRYIHSASMEPVSDTLLLPTRVNRRYQAWQDLNRNLKNYLNLYLDFWRERGGKPLEDLEMDWGSE